MATNEKKKQYDLEYARKKLKRIPLDVTKEKYEEIKAAADEAGQSVNGYIKTAIDDRISELRAQREEQLKEYYYDKWHDDDSYEEKLALRYEENILKEIERRECIAEDETDSEFCGILYEIIQKYWISMIEKSWDKIEEKYGEFSYQIHKFFDSYIEEFNEEMEQAKEDYIKESVGISMEEEESDIQKQAMRECFGAN